jgi:hypothetical protein
MCADTPAKGAVSATSEQPRAGAAGRSGVIEISLGGGRRVRVDASVDAAALARVLDVLRSQSLVDRHRESGIIESVGSRARPRLIHGRFY